MVSLGGGGGPRQTKLGVAHQSWNAIVVRPTNQPTYICLYCMLIEDNHHYTQLVHPKIYICLYTIMQYTIVLHITILYQTFF